MQKLERLIGFENLKERLLRAGIAPRHVKRTLHELRDHYEDAVRHEKSKGSDDVAAAQNAWMRLGDEDALVRSIIARPELRSLPARFPKLVFVAGPIAAWFGAIILTVLGIASILPILRSAGALPALGTVPPEWSHAPLLAVCFFYARVLPLLVGGVVIATAIRQRVTSHAPVFGAALIALVGGFTHISMIFPAAAGDHGALIVGNWILGPLMPFTDGPGAVSDGQIVYGVAIAVLNAAILLTPYVIWRRSYRPTEA